MSVLLRGLEVTGHIKPPEHPGILCKAIRELRYSMLEASRLALKYVALRSGVTERTIQYFEHGDRLLSDEAFAAYVRALNLASEEEIRLHTIYRSYQRRGTFEMELDFYNFHTVVRHPQLQEAIRLLEHLPGPAFIMDDLGFSPVVNTALAELLGMSHASLTNLYLWHAVGTKFHPASPVRKAHETPHNPYFAFAVRMFHQTLDKYFFAPQSIRLQKYLLNLSPHEYGKHWLTHVLFTEPEWIEMPLRVIRYRGERSRWGIRVLDTLAVEIANGPLLFYHIIEWIPVGDVAQAICQEVLPNIRREVIFAREFGLDEYEFG